MIEKLKIKYKVALFNNEEERVLIGFKMEVIDLSDKDHDELEKHLQRYGAYVGQHKTMGEIVIVPCECNLSPNKYKWTGNGFMALGFGYPRPTPLPNGITKDHAFYLMMKANVEGKPIPDECAKWVKWYEDNLKKRNEEHLFRIGKGGL